MENTDLLNQLLGKVPPEIRDSLAAMGALHRPFNAVLAIANNNGREDEREEIIARLIAADFTAEEISVILKIRLETVNIHADNMTSRIPDYRRTLKERKKRRGLNSNERNPCSCRLHRMDRIGLAYAQKMHRVQLPHGYFQIPHGKPCTHLKLCNLSCILLIGGTLSTAETLRVARL